MFNLPQENMLHCCSFSTSADRLLTAAYIRHRHVRNCVSWSVCDVKVRCFKAGLWWKCCFCDFSCRSGMIISGSIRAWWISPNCLKRRRTTTCRCPQKRWSRWTLNMDLSTFILETSFFEADWILPFQFNIWRIFYHFTMMWSHLKSFPRHRWSARFVLGRSHWDFLLLLFINTVQITHDNSEPWSSVAVAARQQLSCSFLHKAFLPSCRRPWLHSLFVVSPLRTLLALGCRVVQVNPNAENALKKIKLTKK